MVENEWNKVEADVWDPEEGGEMSGVYLGVQREVGVNKSNLYNFETEGNKQINVWGSRLIDDAMMIVKVGQQVKIVYKGKIKPEKGNEYKSYEIFTKPISE